MSVLFFVLGGCCCCCCFCCFCCCWCCWCWCWCCYWCCCSCCCCCCCCCCSCLFLFFSRKVTECEMPRKVLSADATRREKVEQAQMDFASPPAIKSDLSCTFFLTLFCFVLFCFLNPVIKQKLLVNVQINILVVSSTLRLGI